jgi:hypothetical protein
MNQKHRDEAEFDSLEVDVPAKSLVGWTISAQVRADSTGKPYVAGVSLRMSGDGPAAPLTTGAWRSLPIGALTDHAIARYLNTRSAPPKPTLATDRQIEHAVWRKANGPYGHSDATYAALAAVFVGRLQAGSREPLADVAKSMDCPKSTANARLQTARKRGLLDGHQLTPKALALLGHADPSKGNRRK